MYEVGCLPKLPFGAYDWNLGFSLKARLGSPTGAKILPDIYLIANEASGSATQFEVIVCILDFQSTGKSVMKDPPSIMLWWIRTETAKIYIVLIDQIVDVTDHFAITDF